MRSLKSFVREKKIHCGKSYMEVDIYPYTETQKNSVKGSRSKRKKISLPKIKDFNDKQAKRLFLQLLNANFLEGGLHLTLTYNREHLPGSMERAEKEVRNYLRRVAYYRKKHNMPPLRYILVNEDMPKRIHHHIIMDSDIQRDELEKLWRKKKKPIGFVNADRLQPMGQDLGALAVYLMKDPKGRKRWSCSQNLTRPWQRTNDSKYSRRGIEKIAKTQPDADFWEKKYPGWHILPIYGYAAEYHDQTGWHIYLKMIKKEE